LFDLLLLIVGLLALVKSADWLVVGASDIAARYDVSPLAIGLTIVSFGTSMPELLVTMISGLRHNPDLAIGNIVGSNIANVLLVLGIAAIIRPLPVRDSTVVSEIPFSLTAALLVGFLANAALFTGNPELSISRMDGGILLLFFALFLLYVYKMNRKPDHFNGDYKINIGTKKATLYVLLGVVGLYIGGQWVVDGAIGLARLWGVNDALLGLTIVAIGTSSPELVASAVAASRGETDIAVGNVVGSNIFNLLWILGITSALIELPFEVVTNTDLLMVIGSSVMILVALVTGRRNTIQRSHGILFVILYAAYLYYVVMRG
jgi:cation:H+ antiporter